MEENKILNEVDEAVSEIDPSSMNDEKLKEAVQKVLEKTRTDNMLLGYRVACATMMQMIAPWHDPKASKREYERIFKRVEEFCGKALKQAENDTENVTESHDDIVEE